MVPVRVDDWPEHKKRGAKEYAGESCAEQGREQLMGLLNLRNNNGV